mmetsp:Transcript_102282/g.272189  ORF Transcript_102282/g.272189 Transcript_102282/m.272189 type:complete len:221 (-) Transcript_102282:7-669(-)
MERLLPHLGAAELAVNDCAVVLQAIQQCDAPIDAEVIPRQVKMGNRGVRCEHLPYGLRTNIIDPVVPKIYMTYGEVELQDVAERLHPGRVPPDGVPLQVQAAERAVDLDSVCKNLGTLCLYAVSSEVQVLHERIVADELSNLRDPLVRDGSIGEAERRCLPVGVQVVEQRLDAVHLRRVDLPLATELAAAAKGTPRPRREGVGGYSPAVLLRRRAPSPRP